MALESDIYNAIANIYLLKVDNRNSRKRREILNIQN